MKRGKAMRTSNNGEPQSRLAFWCIIALALIWPIANAFSQTFTVLKSFGAPTNTNEWNQGEFSALVPGPDGTLYGTATHYEGLVTGSVFKVRPDGTSLAILKTFTNVLGGEHAIHPGPGLTVSGNTLYGTT